MISPRVQRSVQNGSVIAVAMAVMNVGTYGFQMLAAKMLGTQSFGAVGAVMNMLLVLSVASLGIQATAARRIAAEPEHVAQIERSILALTYRLVVPFFLVMLVVSPIVQSVLKLDSIWPAIVIALATVPLTVFGAQAGILQGERRWGALSILYILNGLPRLFLGVTFLMIKPNETVALSAVAVGMVFPVVYGWWVLREKRAAGTPSEEHRARRILQETFRNSQALLAFYALSNVDIVVARNVVDAHDSGLYAAGLMVTKIMVFLPQFVVVVAFPSMSTPAQRLKALARGLGLIGLIGLVGTAGAYLLSPVLLFFIGGSDFAEVQDSLWLFALLGTVLAMLQLLIYSALAKQTGKASLLMWIALVAVVAVGLTTNSVNSLVLVVLSIDLVLLLVLSVLAIRPEAAVTAATQESAPTQA